MAPSVTVVGSGASGIHFAATLLERGYQVTLVDVGKTGPPPTAPQATFNRLKSELDDPTAYFLGAGCQDAVLPGKQGEFYGIPPNKDYVFAHPEGFQATSVGFEPLFSFAQGGLAQAWTGGCYPFNAEETRDFPFPHADLAQGYDEVARRIGVTGADDDLARFMPVHEHLMEGIAFDEHSQLLVDTYARKKEWLNRKLGCYLGRTRVATISRDKDGRPACWRCGRCLWTCPTETLYTPSLTLRACLAHPRFRYEGGLLVEFFRVGEGRRVTALVARTLAGERREIPVETLALGAGCLSSSEIFLRSVLEETGERIQLTGLMDNRQVLVPFVNLRMVGRPYQAETYQYHLLGMGFETPDPRDYVHCQITTLKTALMHPIMQSVPLDLRTAMIVARTMHSALGLVNVNFRDTRRDDNYLTLIDGEAEGETRLSIHYRPDAEEPARLKAACQRVKRALWKLGCIVPPGMMHQRPMGASVHYVGTLPLSREARPRTTDPLGRSHDYPNLYLVDGATFPFLPAKNCTFTLMANAVRIARGAFPKVDGSAAA